MGNLENLHKGRPLAPSNRKDCRGTPLQICRRNVHSQFIFAGASRAAQKQSQTTRSGELMMQKTLAAIGISAAIALAPLAAFAQTDQAAPAAAPAATDTMAPAKDAMKKPKKAKKHMSNKMKKPSEPAEPAAPAEAPKS
jgi:hypothetical protein